MIIFLSMYLARVPFPERGRERGSPSVRVPKAGRYHARALPSPETTFHVSCNKKTSVSMCAVGGVWNSCDRE